VHQAASLLIAVTTLIADTCAGHRPAAIAERDGHADPL